MAIILRDEDMRRLEHLCGGGSEYYNDPWRCIAAIEHRLRTTASVANERNTLRAELTAAQAEIERLRADYAELMHLASTLVSPRDT